MRAILFLVVGVIGLIETLVPGVVVSAFTRVAYRDAEDAEARPWFRTLVRIEGAVLVLVGLVGLFRTARSAGSDDERTEPVEDESSV